MTPNPHSPAHSLRRLRQQKQCHFQAEEKENGATSAIATKRPLSSTLSIVKSKALSLSSASKTLTSALQDITNILSSAAAAVTTNTHLTKPKGATPSNLRNSFCIFEQEPVIGASQQHESDGAVIVPQPEYAPVLVKLDDIPIKLEAFICMRTISASRMACPFQVENVEGEEFERERPLLDDEEQIN
jgi:hypothetical protein